MANSRGKDAVKEFADEISAHASDLNEISKDIDVLIISIPYGAITSLSGSLFKKLPEDAVIIDT